MVSNLISIVSKSMSEANIYHKIVDDFIITRNLKIKIPEIDDNMAYLVGVIMGDGSIIKSKRKKGGYVYMIHIYSGSIKFLNDINRIAYNLFGYKGIFLKDKRKNNTYRISIQSAVIFWYLINLGLKFGKKRDLCIPKIFKTKPSYTLNLIAGLIDTDGHVKSNSNRIQLKQKSKLFLEELEKILNKFNMNSSSVKVNYTDSKPFYYIRFDNKLPLRFKVYASVAQRQSNNKPLLNQMGVIA